MRPAEKIIAVTGICLALTTMSTNAFCEKELDFLFEDCSPFNDSRYFGGEVCASDGDTYPNRLFVLCIGYHSGSGIHVSYKGPCTARGQACPYSPFYNPICATDKKTYANMEALTCHATLDSAMTSLGVLYEGECEWDQLDPCQRNNWESWGHNRVCASNGLTYTNVAQIRCLKKLHPDLEVAHEGGCSPLEVWKTAAQTRSKACWLARNRYEWNPICGNDNVTYPNPFILLCYQPEVKAQFVGECGSPTHFNCLKASKDMMEFNTETAVCGSDGLVYQSEDHLYCATLEDKYLWPQHKGMCTSADDPCKRNLWPGSDAAGNPVCASDGKTYVSPMPSGVPSETTILV